jgi:RNA polymerase sigma-70 factor, ECF subfamily
MNKCMCCYSKMVQVTPVRLQFFVPFGSALRKAAFLFQSAADLFGTNVLEKTSKKEDERHCKDADDDHELASASRAGNLQAFERLVERHQKRMFNLAFRMIGDYEEAAEMVQETFIAAYRSISRFRGDARFSTWLYGICLNRCRDRLKDLRNRAQREVFSINEQGPDSEGQQMDCFSSHDLSALEQLEQKELQERVQRSIDSLDPQYREIIVLRDIQELSYEEIAYILKLNEGTIKSRLFRAREALKTSMEKVFGDCP